MKTLTIELNDDIADEIVRSTLRQSISITEYHRSVLLRKKKLAKHEKEDLKDCEEILKALKPTLAYYSPAE
jgi:hypothetical protein